MQTSTLLVGLVALTLALSSPSYAVSKPSRPNSPLNTEYDTSKACDSIDKNNMGHIAFCVADLLQKEWIRHHKVPFIKRLRRAVTRPKEDPSAKRVLCDNLKKNLSVFTRDPHPEFKHDPNTSPEDVPKIALMEPSTQDKMVTNSLDGVNRYCGSTKDVPRPKKQIMLPPCPTPDALRKKYVMNSFFNAPHIFPLDKTKDGLYLLMIDLAFQTLIESATGRHKENHAWINENLQHVRKNIFRIKAIDESPTSEVYILKENLALANELFKAGSDVLAPDGHPTLIHKLGAKALHLEREALHLEDAARK